MTTALDFVENYTGEVARVGVSPGRRLSRAPARHDGPESIYEYLPTIKKARHARRAVPLRTAEHRHVGCGAIARVTGKSLERALSERILAQARRRAGRVFHKSTQRAPVRRRRLEPDAARSRAVRRNDAARRPLQRAADRAESGRSTTFVAAATAKRSCRPATPRCPAELPTVVGVARRARRLHGARHPRPGDLRRPKAEMVIARFASHPLAANANYDATSLPAYQAVAELLLATPR